MNMAASAAGPIMVLRRRPEIKRGGIFMNSRILLSALAVTLLGAAAVVAAPAPQQPMSFFITSTTSGGGNLGGLAGADKICQDLAAAAGAGGKTWHAYLSTQAANGMPGVNARGRIGTGPWYNAKGVMIAATVGDLHGDGLRDRNNIQKANMLTEKGELIKGAGDMPNQHDILTDAPSRRVWTPPATIGRSIRMPTTRCSAMPIAPAAAMCRGIPRI